MQIYNSIYEEIIATFAYAPIESGGILGRKKDVICKFFFDGGGSPTEYRIRTEILNKVIEDWAKNDIIFCGIIHSHPNGIRSISKTDKAYAEEILLRFPHLKYVIFPIVTVLKGKTQIFCYQYDGHWSHDKLIKE